MRIQRNVNPDAVNQTSQHKLFVEGKNNQEIDPVIIQELLNNNGLSAIEVRAMGACDNVRSTAQALINQHPSYYFLIDRDDQTKETVDESWQSFPDSNAYNMLVWHKRELENYFIEPNYIGKSSLLRPRINIRRHILNECNKRIFLDAANLTLYSLKRRLRQLANISHFRNPNDFRDQNSGTVQLEQLAELDNKKSSAIDILEKEVIRQTYLNFVDELSGGALPLQYGSGTWLERMSGKEVFRVISNQCFQVKNASGVLLQGKEQNKEIAKALVKLPLEIQPLDFQELVKLLKARIRN